MTALRGTRHIGQYQHQLGPALQRLTLPAAVHCQDLTCDRLKEHRDQITERCAFINQCCLDSGNACLPKRKMKGPNRAGWSQDVQPYKEASVRCHTIWTEYGEPQAG